MLVAGEHRDDPRPHPRNERRMTCEHAEISLGAGNIDLVDLAREGQLFRRDEIEMEGSHGLSSLSDRHPRA